MVSGSQLVLDRNERMLLEVFSDLRQVYHNVDAEIVQDGRVPDAYTTKTWPKSGNTSWKLQGSSYLIARAAEEFAQSLQTESPPL